MKALNRSRLLSAIGTVAMCLGLGFQPALAGDPPPQNSSHLDGQNTDYTVMSMSINDPTLLWSNHRNLPGPRAMKGCGPGIVLVEHRQKEAVVGTVFWKQDETSPAKYYVRMLNIDDGTHMWDYPKTDTEYFNEIAFGSSPLVDDLLKKNVWFGDSNSMVMLNKDFGTHHKHWNLGTGIFGDYGILTSFHLAEDQYENANRLVTATGGQEGCLLVFAESSNTVWNTHFCPDANTNFLTRNTVAISPKSSNRKYAYTITTGTGSVEAHRYTRLYAMKVGDCTLDYTALFTEKEYIEYDRGPFNLPARVDASPLVIENEGVPGTFYVIFDRAQGNDEYATCVLHQPLETGDTRLQDEWTCKMPGEAWASFAYGPTYYDNTWQDIVWNFSEPNKIVGIALKDYADEWSAGELVSHINVYNSTDLANHEIRSVLTISSQTSAGSTNAPIAIFGMKDVDDPFEPGSDPTYVVTKTLEIKPDSAADGMTRRPDWYYQLPGTAYFNSAMGQFILRQKTNTISQNSLLFGQMYGKIICLTDTLEMP